MQESSALPKEVSSCRRDQHCSKRLAHAGEPNTDQRGQLMQERSALLREVSSALRKKSGNLCTRGQVSSAQEVSSSRRAQL